MKTFSQCSIALFLLLQATNGQAQTQSDFAINPPVANNSLKKMVLWSTQYYVHQFKSGGTIPFQDGQGKNLGYFADTCTFCKAALEGTAFIVDAEGKTVVINVASTSKKAVVNCRACKDFKKSPLNVERWGAATWSVASGFGNGVRNYKLVPFRTIAVDSKVIPYGTVIYIPAVKGMVILLPNGQKVTHDGYFFAGDTGSAIKGTHIDTFTGVYTGNPFPGIITSSSSKTLTAYVVTDKQITNQLKARHIN